LLHQYQRPVKAVEHAGHRFEYIDVERQDIELADKLAKEVLDRGDDLPPQTRALLTTIDTFTAKLAEEHAIARADVRFTQRELRATTGWGHTQTKVHLARLVELEHVAVHSGGAGRKSRIYGYDGSWSGRGRSVVGPPSRPLSPSDPENMPVAVGLPEKARPGKHRKSASYQQTRPSK
jgi:DNA primase